MFPSYKNLLRIIFHLKHLSFRAKKNDFTVSVKTEYVFLFLGVVLATYDCVICQGKRTYSTSRDHYEKLVKYQTLEAHQLCNSVLMKDGTSKIY